MNGPRREATQAETELRDNNAAVAAGRNGLQSAISPPVVRCLTQFGAGTGAGGTDGGGRGLNHGGRAGWSLDDWWAANWTAAWDGWTRR